MLDAAFSMSATLVSARLNPARIYRNISPDLNSVSIYIFNLNISIGVNNSRIWFDQGHGMVVL